MPSWSCNYRQSAIANWPFSARHLHLPIATPKWSSGCPPAPCCDLLPPPTPSHRSCSVHRLDHAIDRPLAARLIPSAANHTSKGRCFTNLTVNNSQRGSQPIDGLYEQAITRPLPHHELVKLHCCADLLRSSFVFISHFLDTVLTDR